MLLAGQVFGQAPTVTINPTGGNTLTDGLQILVTDTGYLVKKNGKWETNLNPAAPPKDRGLRTYIVIEPRFDVTAPFEPQYLKHCNISAVSGAGTSGNPWKVTSTGYVKDRDNATYQVQSVVTYVNGASHFLLDYIVTAKEDAAGAWVHIYLSEKTMIAGEACGMGFIADNASSGDEYYPATTRPQTVAVYKDPGDCGSPESGAHVFRVKGGFTTWYAAQDDARDNKTGNGFPLQMVANGALVPVAAKGIAVHKVVTFNGPMSPTRDPIRTQRFMVGYENQSYAAVDLNSPVLLPYQDHNFPLVLGFSAATGSGDEGQDDHTPEGIKLRVFTGATSVPTVVKIIATPSGTHPAVAGTDYEILGSLTIPPGDYTMTPAEFDLTNIVIKGNTVIEDSRTLTLSISTDCLKYAQISATNPTAVYTIADDDAADIKLIPTVTTLAEGTSTSIKVKMNGPALATPVTVTINRGLGNAKATDFSPSTFPFTVTIPAGSNEATFNFNALNDLVLETTDSVQLVATATLEGSPKSFSVYMRITDETANNAANKVLTLSAADATEGANASILLALPTGVTSEQALSARIAFSHVTTAAADFDAVITDSVDVTIPADANSTTYTLGLAADNIIEETESYSFGGVMAGFVVNGGSSNIIDANYYAGMPITLTVDQSTLAENGVLTFTASLPGGGGFGHHGEYIAGATSTINGFDYSYLDSYVIISAGEHAITGEVKFIDDDTFEPTETIVLEGVATGYSVVGASADVTDLQSTNAANRVFSLYSWTTTYQEGDEMDIALDFVPNRFTEQDMTVTLSADPASTLDPSEYQLPSPVVVPAGSGATSFRIKFLGDAVVDGDKTLILNVTVDYFGHPETQTMNIIVEDTTTAVTTPTGKNILVTTNPGSGITMLEGNTWEVTFTLDGYTETTPTVINLANTSSGDVATSADIAGGIPTSVTIPANSSSVTLSLPLIDDHVYEKIEQLKLAFSAAGYTFNHTSAEVLIDGDDSMTGQQLGLDVSNPNLLEGGTATVTVSLPSDYVAGFAIPVTLTRTASSTATNGDLTGVPTTVTIPAGAHDFSFVVTAAADDSLEVAEYYEMEASATNFSENWNGINITDVTSMDQNNFLVTMVPEKTTLGKGETIKVWVNLPSNIYIGTGFNYTVGLQVYTDPTVTGAQYTVPTTFTFPEGANGGYFDLATHSDGVTDGDEMFIVYIDEMHPSGAYLSADATLTLQDAAIIPEIHVAVPAASMTEGSGITVTFSLPSGYTSPSPITINLAKGTVTPAAVDADFTAPIPTSVTIPANASMVQMTLNASADNMIELLEKLRLTPSATGYTFDLTDIDLDVIDADYTAGMPVALSFTPASVTEGTSAAIRASLPGTLTASYDIDVTVNKGASSTAATGDHGALPATLHIAAGSNASANTTVTTAADNILEVAETLIAEGTITGFTVSAATLTINDATSTNPLNTKLTLTPSLSTIAEGGSTTVTVSLPTGITASNPINITLSSGAGSSVGLTAADYDMPVSVTIPAGSNSVNFTVDAETDAVIEGAEDPEILAQSTVYGNVETATTTIHITDATTVSVIDVNVSTATVNEGGSTTITFSLPSGVTSSSAIIISLAKNTVTPAAGDADFDAAIPTSVTIAANTSSASMTLNAIADQIIEEQEKLQLAPTATGYTFSQSVIDIEVADGDYTGNNTVTLSVTPASVAEGSGSTLRAALPGTLVASYPITITLNKDAASTAGAADHGTLPASITIPAGSNSATTALTTATDNILESSETLVIGGTATGFTVNATTLTITDVTSTNPLHTKISLSPATTTIAEGASATMTISLPAGITADADIAVSLSRGAGSSASLGTGEYTLPASVTILAGNNSATFNVAAGTDGDIEATEDLHIDAAATVYGNSETATAVVAITDATGTPVIDVNISATSINEGDGVTVTFSLPSGVTSAFPIVINLAQGGATPAVVDADFTTAIPTSLTIAANASSASFTLTAETDNIIEELEKLQLTATATGYTFSQSLIAIDVVDGDYPTNNTVTLSVNPTSVAEGSGSTLRASLPGTLVASYPIAVTITKGAASTADLADHGTLPASILIPAGSNSATASLTTNTDNVLEPSETLVVNGTATGFTVNTTTLTITDVTSTDPLNTKISLSPATTTIAEGASANMTVSLPAGITAAADITVSLSRGAGSSASLGTSEYTLPTSVTIAAGFNNATFTVSAATDADIEATEDLHIDAAAMVYGNSETATTVVSITDATATPVIDVNVTAASINEGGAVTVTFSLPGGVTSTFPIVINLARGTATPAVEDADFTTAIPASVTIAANASAASFTLTADADNIIEELEKLQLIATATGYTFSQSTINVDVADGDYAANNTVTLSVTPASVAEGSGSTLRASLPGTLVASYPITVTLHKDVASTAGAADHGALPASIIIPAGINSATASLTTASDNILESSETLVVNGTASGFTVNAATLTITDVTGIDPLNTKISLNPATTTIAEGASATMTISLPSGITADADIVVNLSRGAGSSASLNTGEYTLPASATIQAGHNSVTFSVTAGADSDIESTEDLHIDAAATVYGNNETTTAIVSITDTTPAPVIDVNVSAASINEGGAVTVTFSLPGGVTSTFPITINLAQAATTVTDADFTGAIPSGITIPANTAAVSFTLTAAADNIIEQTEKLQLQPTASGYAFSHATIDVDVVDVDITLHNSITLALTPGNVTEGGAATLQATLPAGITTAYAINININKGFTSTAVAADHGILPATLTIPAGGNASNMVNISTNTDNLLEVAETLVVEGAYSGFSVMAATLTINDATSTDPLNTQLTFTSDAATINEGESTTVRVSLPSGILATSDINVSLARGAASSASLGTSEYSFPGSVTIPAGVNSATFILAASADDNVLEAAETLELTLSANVYGNTQSLATSVVIADATSLVPGNLHIQLSIDSSSLSEGNTSKVQVQLAPGITADYPIVISLSADASSTATGTDHSALPATIQINAGANSAEFDLTALADGEEEDDETLVMRATTAGFTINNASVLIPGDNVPAYSVLVEKLADAAEPATNGSFRVRLSGGATAKKMCRLRTPSVVPR
ncbi:hypothetical protein MKQ70_18145 [Chitinophaga sedimenti]|uniref:beta strand repeat-containing protein n=1 Tax=Chitinophaga sedimenti TaxID=2033606 RepID=UPI002005A2CC|nr:Calx-beta domain-containing protein [Chitinophaga sedimenti]MCK7556836.1 hypothetical protein [Chitinophaga sedimenti]